MAFFLILSAGCSTAKKDAIKKVTVGMDKADVLELVGSPTRTGRAPGMDRWIYEYDTPTGMETTFIFFHGGFVKYVGAEEIPTDRSIRVLPSKDTKAPAGQGSGDFKNLDN